MPFNLITVLPVVVMAVLGFFVMRKVPRIVRDSQSNWVNFIFMVFVIALFVPAMEEVLFRLPLIVLFDEVSTISWVGIVASALIFGALHLKDSFVEKVLQKKEEEITSVPITKKRKLVKSLSGFGVITLLGCLFGFFAVQTDGLLKPFLLHAIWNLFAVFIRIFLLALLKAFTVETADKKIEY